MGLAIAMERNTGGILTKKRNISVQNPSGSLKMVSKKMRLQSLHIMINVILSIFFTTLHQAFFFQHKQNFVYVSINCMSVFDGTQISKCYVLKV